MGQTAQMSAQVPTGRPPGLAVLLVIITCPKGVKTDLNARLNGPISRVMFTLKVNWATFVHGPTGSFQ